MSFNQIFKNNLINLPPLKIINCHAGKLPFYRGRNVLNWVLINDENEFGITVHFIDEGIDTGDIILQKTFKIDDTDDYQTLLSRAYKECGSILYDSILQRHHRACDRRLLRDRKGHRPRIGRPGAARWPAVWLPRAGVMPARISCPIKPSNHLMVGSLWLAGMMVSTVIL